MLHKLGYEYTCPECHRPCKDEDIAPSGEKCIGCKGDPERPSGLFVERLLTGMASAGRLV